MMRQIETPRVIRSLIILLACTCILVMVGFRTEAQETRPVGKTKADQQRNAVLLSGYDYKKYPEALTGYTGQDLQRVGFVRWEPAIRVRVGARGNFKSAMARLPDGKLILAVCRYNNEADPTKKLFEVFVYESSDVGLSWEEIGQTPLFGKEPSLATLPDGTLILITHGGFFAQGPNKKHHLYRSKDGGRTWKASIYEGADYPRSVIIEPDGSLLTITALKPGWSGGGRDSPNLQIRRSKDDGRTWTSSAGIVDWNWKNFGEVAAIRLKNGRLLAALRRQIPGTRGEGFQDTVLTESTDDGTSWSRPWQLTTTAQVHAYLTELDDGRLLCTYSNYHVPWGVSAILSDDRGRTWDMDNTIRLSISNGFWAGWAGTLQLPDGSLITSYATTTYDKWEPRFDRVYAYGGTTCFDIVTSEVLHWHLPEQKP